MDDGAERMRRQRLGQAITVGEIDAEIMERRARLGGDRRKVREAVALQPDVVIGKEAVDSDDALAAAQQGGGNRGADKACRAGDQYRNGNAPRTPGGDAAHKSGEAAAMQWLPGADIRVKEPPRSY